MTQAEAPPEEQMRGLVAKIRTLAAESHKLSKSSPLRMIAKETGIRLANAALEVEEWMGWVE